MFGRGLVDVEGQGLGRVLVTPTLTTGQCIDRGRQHGQEWPAGPVRWREHGSGHGRTSGRGMSARRPLDTRSGADQSRVCVWGGGGGGGVGINILTGGQSVKWSVCGRRTLSWRPKTLGLRYYVRLSGVLCRNCLCNSLVLLVQPYCVLFLVYLFYDRLNLDNIIVIRQIRKGYV